MAERRPLVWGYAPGVPQSATNGWFPYNVYELPPGDTIASTYVSDDVPAGSNAFRAIQTSAQSIPNAADTVVSLPTVARSSTLVTSSVTGAGHQFTINKSGTWAVSTTTRSAGATSGVLYSALYQVVSGTATILTAQDSALAQGARTRSLSLTDYFDSGTAFYLLVYQLTGAALALEPGGGQWVNLRLAWLRP